MDWVHCNKCYFQPGDVANKKFFVTNCGHIYCDECHQPNKSVECHICNVQYNVIPLSSSMSPEVEIYFLDPLMNIKKQIKVLEFQQSHRLRLVSHHRDRLQNYKTMKKENFNLNEELKLFKKENEDLREEIKRIKRNFHEYKKNCENTLSSKNKRIHSFSQFTPKDAPEHSSILMKRSVPTEKNITLNLKRPSGSNFFLMTESRPQSEVFTSPEIRKFAPSYRSYKTSTPDIGTPPTPETFFKACSKKDVLQRRVNLPSGPSPFTRIGLHGLSLSRSTSTPKRETSIPNKFPKYFK